MAHAKTHQRNKQTYQHSFGQIKPAPCLFAPPETGVLQASFNLSQSQGSFSFCRCWPGMFGNCCPSTTDRLFVKPFFALTVIDDFAPFAFATMDELWSTMVQTWANVRSTLLLDLELPFLDRRVFSWWCVPRIHMHMRMDKGFVPKIQDKTIQIAQCTNSYIYI